MKVLAFRPELCITTSHTHQPRRPGLQHPHQRQNATVTRLINGCGTGERLRDKFPSYQTALLFPGRCALQRLHVFFSHFCLNHCRCSVAAAEFCLTRSASITSDIYSRKQVFGKFGQFGIFPATEKGLFLQKRCSPGEI